MALRQRHDSLGTRPAENGLSHPYLFLEATVRNRNALSPRSWKQMNCSCVPSGNPIDTQFYLGLATVTETGSVLASAFFLASLFPFTTVVGSFPPKI